MRAVAALLCIAPFAVSAVAHAAEWDGEFRPPGTANTADAFVEAPGASALVFERVADANDDPLDDRAILRRIVRARTQAYAVTLDPGLFPEPMVADASRVCATFITGASSGVQCFSIATGARVLHFLSGRNDVAYEVWRVLPGAVRVVESAAFVEGRPRGDGRVLDLLSDGTVRVVADLPGPSFDRITATNEAGAFLRVNGGLPTPATAPETYVLYDASGVPAGEPVASPFNQTTQRSRTVVLPDGSVAILNRRRVDNANVWSILRLDETGRVRWLRDFPGNVGTPRLEFTGQELLISYGSFPVLPPGNVPEERIDSPLQAVLVSVNPATGDENWRTTFPSAVNGPYLVEGRGNLIMHVLQLRSGIYLRRFDRETGRLAGLDRRSCGATFCEIENLWIDDEGGLQVGVRYAPDQNRERWALLREDEPFATSAGRYSVGSPAVEGAWYSPTTTGQGLVIDRIDDDGSLFATWFTHDVVRDADGPEGLRWFTIQGAITGDGTDVSQLGLYENANGTFGAGTTTATRVGTARIAGLDCNTLRLDYDFDAATGLPDGTTTLVRATPANVSCAFPYVAQRAARNGFDVAQTGHWFAPATAGQGFSFIVTPATTTADGSVLGAWFTYDATVDDDRAHHWFTLAGEISPGLAATSGLPMRIYRSTGGVFESQPALDVDEVGTATLRFLTCDSARVEFVFDADAGAGFGGRRGVVELVGESCD